MQLVGDTDDCEPDTSKQDHLEDPVIWMLFREIPLQGEDGWHIKLPAAEETEPVIEEKVMSDIFIDVVLLGPSS